MNTATRINKADINGTKTTEPPKSIAAQVFDTLSVLENHLGNTIQAIHLFGSVVDGDLKPLFGCIMPGACDIWHYQARTNAAIPTKVGNAK